MSGLEPFIAASLASIGGTAGTAAAGTAAAGTAAAGTAAGTAAATAGAIGAGAASAGELALLASASQGLTAAAGTGLTAGQALAGAGALSGIAGAGASLLAKPPKIDAPTMPTRDNARLEADQRSMALKRRGRAATLLTGSQGVTSAPTLGSPSLTGTM